MNDVAARLDDVRRELADAARDSGRDPAEVRLVAVSKTKSARAIRDAYAASQRDFGENYVQEMQKKAAELADLPDLRWHFIGHLQRNKAKVVAQIASAVHTVDSERLAKELGKRTAEAAAEGAKARGPSDARLRVFVEVNVGGEAQKTGCAPAELAAVLAAIESEPALSLVGLMTVPPYTDDPADSRAPFDRLARLRDEHGGAARLPELSMGMTRDLRYAVLAGATMVRVGTGIFGERS